MRNLNKPKETDAQFHGPGAATGFEQRLAEGKARAERQAGELGPATRLTGWGLALVEIFVQRKFWLAHLESHPPELVLVTTRDTNELEPRESQAQLAELPRIATFLQDHYERRWQLGDFITFGRCTAPPGRVKEP